jgi:methyltransferase (TIGR00027 family)
VAITDPISRTARLTAAARARESRRADRLFDDPLAAELAGAEGVAFMERFEAAALPAGVTLPAENPYIALRTRFFDDFLVEAVVGSGARQVVLLAAGLDTRAFRLDWPAGTRLHELDRQEVLQAKQEVLDRAGARARCDRRATGVDLAARWDGALDAAGFDRAAPSVWLVEGLLPYLDATAAGALIADVAALSAAGSRLGIDVIGRSFLESPWTAAQLAALEREGAPWKFGTDDPEGWLGALGWDATARRPGDEGVRFRPWPYPMLPRGTPGFPSSFLVTAVRRPLTR